MASLSTSMFEQNGQSLYSLQPCGCLEDIFWCGVQLVFGRARVVDTILGSKRARAAHLDLRGVY